MRLVALVPILAGCGRIGFDPGGPPSFPNLPASCVETLDVSFDAFPPPSWDLQGSVEQVVDATAPESPNVAQFTYPIGFPGGNPPGQLGLGLTSDTLRDIYIGVIWKASDPWQGHDSAQNVIYYYKQYKGGGYVNSTLTMVGSDVPYHLEITYDGTNYSSNVEDVVVTLGQWHTLEQHRTQNTAGTADGVLEWWIDGVLVARYTNITFDPSPNGEMDLSPSWGGIGDVKTEMDYVWMDRAIVCGS